MRDICSLLWCALVGLFRSRASLEAEILLLRHQLNVLRRKSTSEWSLLTLTVSCLPGSIIWPGSAQCSEDRQAGDRDPLAPRWLAGLLAQEIRAARGRPQTPREIRRLIRDVSLANPLWGAPRIHGELLKLGIEIGQTTVARYMDKERRPPSQGWRTFISNHAEGIAALDLFVVPTLSFRLVFGLLILRHDRR